MKLRISTNPQKSQTQLGRYRENIGQKQKMVDKYCTNYLRIIPFTLRLQGQKIFDFIYVMCFIGEINLVIGKLTIYFQYY